MEDEKQLTLSATFETLITSQRVQTLPLKHALIFLLFPSVIMLMLVNFVVHLFSWLDFKNHFPIPWTGLLQ